MQPPSHKHGAVQGSLHGNSPAGSGPATPANGKQGSHPGPSDNGKAASKDLTRQGGGPPDQHPPDPHHIPPLSLLEQARGSAGSTAPGDRPSFNRTGSVNSNRSSFASEGFGSKLMQARMSGTRGSHDAATPPAVLAPVDEGRSSQQARLSSIAAADVMGLGGEKAGTATTRGERRALRAYWALRGIVRDVGSRYESEGCQGRAVSGWYKVVRVLG